MHATSLVAGATILLAQCGAAMPGPWSVPQEHFEVLALRHATPLNLDAVADVTCLNTEAHIVFHEQNAAQLAICGGFAGSRCQGQGSSTVGTRGSAKFTLAAAGRGRAITLSKVRWEECVRAAREKCPTGSLSGTCLGGASGGGDVLFSLESTMYALD